MFTKTVFALLTATATLGAVITRDESHNVQLIDNCGSGNAVFLHQGGPAQGSGTINGPLNGGVAWVDGFAGTDYQSSGVNCGIVEFSTDDLGERPGRCLML
ncbi:hypothetical protein IAU60_002571 [Kwoniella sp. DSM 27419]